MSVYMKLFFVLGQSDIVFKLELALVVNIVCMRIFGNGVSQLESLSIQLSYT